jgi:hypothetical protein
MKADPPKKSSNESASPSSEEPSNAESAASSPTSGTATPTESVTAVDSESQEGSPSTSELISESTENGLDGHGHASKASPENKGRVKEEPKKDDEAAKTAKQIIGKITNLVTSDVVTIWRASDFPLISKYCFPC